MSKQAKVWEVIKECGFTLVSIGVMAANLYTFIMIIIYGFYQIWEPWQWLLYTEAAIDFLYIIWGVERLKKDVIHAKNSLHGL